MCLAIPAKVIEKSDDGMLKATVGNGPTCLTVSGEPDAAEDAHKPRHFVEKAAQRAAQGEQGDDRKQHDIQYIQVVRKRHRKKGLRVFPLRGRYGKRCNPADHSVIMRNTL